MNRTASANAGAILALVLAIPVALGAVAFLSPFRTAPEPEDDPPPAVVPKAKAKTPTPKKGEPKPDGKKDDGKKEDGKKTELPVAPALRLETEDDKKLRAQA
ncbi:MAG: hypothetical protein K2V38_12250, partial [Gemmataceae bacterium]|nr:hypothetical protein [Gemmataceae bacterium]